MYFATVDWLTAMPSFRSSPWIRGAPQRGLASRHRADQRADVGRVRWAGPCAVGSSRSRTGGSRGGARRPPSRAARGRVPPAIQSRCARARSRAGGRLTVRRTRGRRERSRTRSWCLSARISRCSAVRERTSERSARRADRRRRASPIEAYPTAKTPMNRPYGLSGRHSDPEAVLRIEKVAWREAMVFGDNSRASWDLSILVVCVHQEFPIASSFPRHCAALVLCLDPVAQLTSMVRFPTSPPRRS